MARSGRCKTCGKMIRPTAKDMSVGAASRIHYWKYHPEVMLGGQANRDWEGAKRLPRKGKGAAKKRVRR